ncbi:DUF748 domain-containing protein [Neptuniibacter sp. CAU 1671]|uniref:DUF748 domain-containing protein n=1 Tax=Neptuniibacter sp. CAU 1671 TaxID=3032593 RepID=UPI0023DBE736|nr:DUF748 domain-containing protein [Neptuniibacter sp. CAU 1671]MDF2182617.1 DUF748 domain-containing protein [Neptuniibacter sp. CAU 1671]
MLRWLIAVVLVVLLMVHNLPYLLRDQAVIWLRSHGAEDARLSAVEINWFKGEFRLQGLKATAAERPPMQIDQLELGIDYAALSDKRLLLKLIDLSGVQMGVRQTADALWLGPINLLALQSQEAEPEAAEPDAPSEWSVGFSKIELSNIDWQAELPNQTHRLTLNQASVQDLLLWAPEQATQLKLEGALNGAPINLQSEALPLPEQKSTRLKIKLQDFPVHSLTAPWVPGLRARVDLDLAIDASSNLAQQSFTVQQQGSIRIRNLSFSQESLALSQQALDWSGNASVVWQEGALQQLATDSQVSLEGSELSQGDESFALGSGRFNAVVNGTLSDLKASLTDLQVSQLDARLPGQQYQLQQGELSADLQLQDGLPRLIQLASLNLTQLALAIGNSDPYRIGVAQLTTQGEMTADPENRWQAVIPVLSVQNTQLSRSGTALVLLAGLDGQNIDVANNAEQVSVAGVRFNQLQVQGQDQTLSQWQQIELDALKLQQMQSLQINQMTLSGGRNRLLLSEQRQPVEFNWLIERLQPEQSTTSATVSTPQSDAEPFKVKINRVIVKGDNRIAFVDQGVKPVLNTELELKKLQLDALDTGSDQPTRFELQSQLGKFTQLNAQGQMELFSGNYGGDWTVDLKALDLPMVSPYFSQFTGYLLRNGQLNISSRGSVKKRKLDGKTDIFLNRIEVQRDKSDRSDAFNEKVTMPLETALMVLKDKDENIELDLELNGSLDDPQFGYQAIINKLAGKGLKNAAFGYLTKSLQPFGALITVAQMAMDAAEKGSFIQLQPVLFEPLSAELSGDGKTYMNKLAAMLQERPAMRLNICGQVVAADAEPMLKQLTDANRKATPEELKALLQTELQALAAARGDQIKTALSQQNVSVERLFTCYPQVDPAATGEPRTLLGL